MKLFGYHAVPDLRVFLCLPRWAAWLFIGARESCRAAESRPWRGIGRNSRVILLMALLSALPGLHGAEEPVKKPLFLPKSPTAAAYVLARLSNKELLEAPRSEFVYVALLQRGGLDRKVRIEALEGLAKARGTTPLAELIKGIADLEKRAEETSAVLRELTGLLGQHKPSELSTKREELERLAQESESPLGRRIGYAGLISADASVEKSWQLAASDPAKLADLIHSVPLLRDAALRASLHPKLEPLLKEAAPPAVRQAAIAVISSVPVRETETFSTLAGLVEAGDEKAAAIASLQRIPRRSWAKERAEPLLESLIGYLKGVPVERRTEPDVINAFQLASDLASLLPPEKSGAIGKTLRAIGVSVFVIRTIHEQMLYDKSLIVVEAGKPVEIILKNEDSMPHNLVIVTPKSSEEIGRLAETLPDPDSEGRIHVPKSPKVLHATKMIDQGQEAKLSFIAPEEEGDYQYVCTFPGHWMRMLGTLAVVKNVEAYLASRPAAAPPTETEWKLADFEADLRLATTGRNLASGKEIFSKLACVQCHKLGKEGYAYGPDLTDVLARRKGDRAAVLSEILEPSKVIEDRYKNHSFELSDGDELSGMIIKEEGDEVFVHTGPSDALIRPLKKASIKKRETQGSSLMPMGLLNQLSKNQVLDLLSYMESGGNAAGHAHGH